MRFSLRIKLMGIIVLVIAAMAVVGWRGVAPVDKIDRFMPEQINDFFPARQFLEERQGFWADPGQGCHVPE